ncbi:DEDD exonuclease domain-containing protein [uncultured Aeromicrobium sp.]|uniref:DEDD exonuclease domain-containing protein n=1 Tax=uncultured Aeromicrobium sp. TaxID=337820 RepID=UPI0025FEBA06|nr:DEDD exonuclease domain-containing protein [uncultured Aeromicrobium sp.]
MLIQPTFDDLGRPLLDTTFCVVDLETTGGSPAKGSQITEIGAVKIRAGEVLGEFQTLVNPDASIPAFITTLTGITDQMVIDAPRIGEVLPSFLEFARGCVLVAHNAPFDTSFLRHAATELDIVWPRFEVLDTAVLARRTLLRDEVPNVKLATLAAKFSDVAPDHRALTDARATVDVLHALFERLGSLGITTFEEVRDFTSTVSPAQRAKRHLADGLPDAPGVYLFRRGDGEVLYVGTSRSLRRRVRSYFTRAETRSRMGEMIALAERVDPVVCATALEAQVRELRLIDAHRPPYNQRSKYPDRQSWIKLTSEPWPRLSIVTRVLDDGADYIGPFRRTAAQSALAALHESFRVRQCTTRFGKVPRRSACVLAEIGRCLSPCDGNVDAERYAAEVESLRRALHGDPAAHVVRRLEEKMAQLAAVERFEDATAWRDRLAAFLRGARRSQRLRSLIEQPQLVAAARHEQGWEVHVVRYGRLAAAGILRRGTAARSWIEALTLSAETVLPGRGPCPSGLVEETEAILRWLEQPGIRLVEGSWASPRWSTARHLPRYEVDRSMLAV